VVLRNRRGEFGSLEDISYAQSRAGSSEDDNRTPNTRQQAIVVRQQTVDSRQQTVESKRGDSR
jgi:hypothetical protein